MLLEYSKSIYWYTFMRRCQIYLRIIKGYLCDFLFFKYIFIFVDCNRSAILTVLALLSTNIGKINICFNILCLQEIKKFLSVYYWVPWYRLLLCNMRKSNLHLIGNCRGSKSIFYGSFVVPRIVRIHILYVL